MFSHARFSSRILLAATLIILPQAVLAKATCPADFPSKPIRFVVGLGAGGGTDAIGRGVATGLEQIQGWTVPVENKPGAGGALVVQWLKQQAADGYTVAVTSTDAMTLLPAQGDSTFMWQDFDYLGSGMQTWSALVATVDKPFNTIPEFVEFARKNGKATIAVAGFSQEVIVRQIIDQYKVNIIAIPGNGAAEAMKEALGGHVDATMQGTLHVAQIKAGKMKQLASLIDRRVPYAPNSGTMAEQGVSAVPQDSHTIFVIPKGVPAAIKACLVQAVDESIKSAEYKSLMGKFDNEPFNLGPDKMLPALERTFAVYKKINDQIKSSGK
jgi:tripartite-type tricarboxylate transporter receptor subunit TctC